MRDSSPGSRHSPAPRRWGVRARVRPAAGAGDRRHEDQPARRPGPLPRRRGVDVDLDRAARRRPGRASRPATCSRWGRSSRSATRSGSPTGSCSDCGSERCWRSPPGGWCGCSTRCSDARAASPSSSRARSSCSTRSSSPTPTAPRSTLLAYAALPVAAARRAPGPARVPAAGAGRRRSRLLVAASGGGINGAVTAWMLLGPVLLLLYELAVHARRLARRPAASLWRDAADDVLTSLWWIVPAYVQSSYGIDFLHFTEQPGTIWGTTSATETPAPDELLAVLRRDRLHRAGDPVLRRRSTRCCSRCRSWSRRCCFPAAALGGFVWTRRWRYGPFFLGLALIAALVMQAPASPTGRRFATGSRSPTTTSPSLRFLRASYKAAPLLAVALACLAGVAAGQAWWRLGARRGAARWRGGRRPLACWRWRAWPLVTGQAQDPQVSYKAIPAAWRAAAARPRPRAAAQLPGDRAARRPVLVLHLGRDRRPDPARRCPSARSPSAPRCPTPTCGRPICCGRSTGSCTSSGCCPASSRRCCR